MTAVTEMPCHFAALRLADGQIPRPAALSERIKGWLIDAGQRIEADSVMPDGPIWLQTPEATIRVAAEHDSRLCVHVAERTDAARASASEALLLDLVYRLAVRLGAEHIEWQDRDSVVNASEFVALAGRAAGGVRPVRPAAPRDIPRVAQRPALPSAGAVRPPSADLRDALDLQAAEETAAAQSAPRQLAAWTFSGAAALVWLPLAPVLLAVQLRDGPDLRLAAQTWSLAGLFVALENAGAIGRVAAIIPV